MSCPDRSWVRKAPPCPSTTLLDKWLVVAPVVTDKLGGRVVRSRGRCRLQVDGLAFRRILAMLLDRAVSDVVPQYEKASYSLAGSCLAR